MHTLARLVYCSRLAGPPNAEALQSIQLSAARNNWRDEITGALILHQQRFIQVLEGARGDLSACFVRIARDTRHSGLTLLSFGPITTRDFDDWSMRLLPPAPSVASRISAFFEELDAAVDPQAGDRAVDILRSTLTRSVPLQ